VYITDDKLCDNVVTVCAFLITTYIFLSNWDIMSVILNPMTRWPLDPCANNSNIVMQAYGSNTDLRMRAPFSTAMHFPSLETNALSSTSGAGTSVEPPSEPPEAAPKPFMRWFAGIRGVCILVIILSHLQAGLNKNDNLWGYLLGLPPWLSAVLWPLGATYADTAIALKILVMCTGFGLSLSCSRRDVNFNSRAVYLSFVKTRLHRLLLLCYINIAVYMLQDMVITRSFHFTDKDHWIDLAHTLTFTSQFTTKRFFPRVNGVLWYMGQLIVSSVVTFPVLHMVMKKLGPVLCYATTSVLSALVRYFGVLYTPSAQLTAMHHPISMSFLGYMGMFCAGMAAFQIMSAGNAKYSVWPQYAQMSMWGVKWLLFVAGYAVVARHAFRADFIQRQAWHLNYDDSLWGKFVVQISFLDIPLELALLALFLSLGLHSRWRTMPEILMSLYPLVLSGSMTFSLFVWHFKPCSSILWGDVTVLNCTSYTLFSLLPVALLSYRCIEKYEVVGFFKPFRF
jgi:hypothetical protein